MIAVVRHHDDEQGIKVYEAQDAEELTNLLIRYVASGKDEEKTIRGEMPGANDFFSTKFIGLWEKSVTVSLGFVTRIVSFTHGVDARVEDLHEQAE
ncbi:MULTISPECIES: hypothetical protein [Nocardiopsis]|uniref:Uncharacterized protein n=1 Tax=Nocardiopsis sinuspersici TaxID=501010 RepID=A0A1V3BVA8_9ACTN|nr:MULTISPECIES: hypothetical protein [Nocardiopsis]OOC52607.1 hypothetical protein NOSIN_01165 [Nocardiopsis sinuspersici]